MATKKYSLTIIIEGEELTREMAEEIADRCRSYASGALSVAYENRHLEDSYDTLFVERPAQVKAILE